MGHTIQHYDYPGNADTKKVEQELANYVAKRCFQEGGHLSKIRWIDSEPCANEDEARIKIEHLDKGWYDCIAVKYYDAYNIPETEKLRRCEQPTHKPIASTTNLRLHSILQMQKRNISAAKIAAPRLRESTCEEIFALFAMPICVLKQRSTALLLLKQRQIRVRILLRQN